MHVPEAGWRSDTGPLLPVARNSRCHLMRPDLAVVIRPELDEPNPLDKRIGRYLGVDGK